MDKLKLLFSICFTIVIFQSATAQNNLIKLSKLKEGVKIEFLDKENISEDIIKDGLKRIGHRQVFSQWEKRPNELKDIHIQSLEVIYLQEGRIFFGEKYDLPMDFFKYSREFKSSFYLKSGDVRVAFWTPQKLNGVTMTAHNYTDSLSASLDVCISHNERRNLSLKKSDLWACTKSGFVLKEQAFSLAILLSEDDLVREYPSLKELFDYGFSFSSNFYHHKVSKHPKEDAISQIFMRDEGLVLKKDNIKIFIKKALVKNHLFYSEKLYISRTLIGSTDYAFSKREWRNTIKPLKRQKTFPFFGFYINETISNRNATSKYIKIKYKPGYVL